MSERSNTNHINPGQREVAQGLVAHTARNLNYGAAGNELNGLADLSGQHVVEQNDIGAGAEGLADFGQCLCLDLNLCRVRRGGAATLDGLRERTGRGDVVILDEDMFAE